MSTTFYADDQRSALAFLMRHGNLAVPCSRYGADTESCAVFAFAASCVLAFETGEDITADTLDHMMGLVVNDHDDPAQLMLDHGDEEHRLMLNEAGITSFGELV